MVGPNDDRYIHPEVVDPEAEKQILREIDPDLPTLFLDVDGVLNSMNQNLAAHPWDQAYLTLARPSFSDRSWPIRTSVMLGPALMSLGVNIVWLTTWKYDANTAISPLVGLPEDLPVGDWTGPVKFSEGLQDWKFKVVDQHLAHHNHPVIWVDDEAIPHWMENHLDETGTRERTLLVRTNHITGLTPGEIDDIRNWLETR